MKYKTPIGIMYCGTRKASSSDVEVSDEEYALTVSRYWQTHDGSVYMGQSALSETDAEITEAQFRTDHSTTKAALTDELNSLRSECDALDTAAIRPLRAFAAGTITNDDKIYLAKNEASIATKRARIKEIQAILNN